MASNFATVHMDKYRDIFPWATDQYWLGTADYGFKGLVTTNMRFDEDAATVMALRDDADTAYTNMRLAHIYGPLAETPAHLTIGDAGTTAHSLDSEDDLMVTGELEVKGASFFDGALKVSDDVIFALGTDGDQAMLNRSSVLNANTALTNVLIGTPVSQAIAANSLMISGITANGDIGMYVNKGGNSQMVLWADGSTGDTAIMAATGQSVDTYIAGAKEIDYATGAMAFQQATTISTTTGDLTIDPTASLNVTLTDDDADAFDVANTAASYYLIDTRNTVAAVKAHTFDTEDATLASAAGAIYALANFPAYTMTYTGATGVTSLVSSVIFGSATLTHASALAVTKATTIEVSPPIEGTLTLATASAIRILNAGSGTPTTQVGLYIEDLTAGATSNYSIYTNAGQVHLGGALDLNAGITIDPTTTGTFLDFVLETEWTAGTLIRADWGSGVTATEAIVGMILDFTNLTPLATKAVYGYELKMPAFTQAAASTTNLAGFTLSTAGALEQNTGAGTINWFGALITMPDITATTGSVVSQGITITPGSWTSGTERGIHFSGDPHDGAITGAANVTFKVASSLVIVMADDDTNPFYLMNSTSYYYLVNTQNTVVGTIAHLFDTEDVTLASAADAVSTLLSTNAYTLNYSGSTQVTSLQPTVNLQAVTLVGAAAVTVDKATTLEVIAPVESTNVTLTHTSAIRIMNAGGTPANHVGIMFDAALTGGTVTNTGIDLATNTIINAGNITATDAAGPAIVNEAATTTTPTLIPNQADLTTGIGWATAALHLVVSGATAGHFTTGYQYLPSILFIGDAMVANANMTTGITIDSGATYDQVLAFHKNGIAHGMTNYGLTNCFGAVRAQASNEGGLRIDGLTEANIAFNVVALGTTEDLTKTTTSTGLIYMATGKAAGVSFGAPSANANLFVIESNAVVKFIGDQDGDWHVTDLVCGLGEGGSTALTGGEVRAPHLAGGTNQAGADLTIAAGQGTGTGGVGQIIFQTPRVGTTGATPHTLTTILTLDEATATFAGGLTTGASNVYINDTANANMTVGLTINQASNADEILALKSSNVTQPFTTYAEADTYCHFKKYHATQGGTVLRGFSGGTVGLYLWGTGVTDNTAKTTSANGYVEIFAAKSTGTTVTTPAADANLFVISSNGVVKFIGDHDGDWHVTDIVCGFGEGGVTALTGGEIRAPNCASGEGDDNIAGADLTVSPGLGRGSGTLGKVIIKGAVAAAADTVQTLTTVLTVQGTAVAIAGSMTATTIGAFQATGAIDFNTQACTSIDINSGTIAGVTIDGDLTWSSAQTGVTLTSPAINGTVTTTGLTLPAITLGGDILMGDTLNITSGAAVDDWFSLQAYRTHANNTDYIDVIRVANTGVENDTGLLGFFGTAPVNQPSAYTQTFATADKTHANRTGLTLTDNSGTGATDNTIGAIGIGGVVGQDIPDAIGELADEVNKIIADLADTAAVLNALVDDLQELGLVA